MALLLKLLLFFALKGDSEKIIGTFLVGRAITIWEVIQKRNQDPIYKTHTKIEAKILRGITFAIAKLEER